MSHALLRRRVMAPAWTPAKLTGVVAWWHAGDQAGANGSSIASWTDRVSGIVASQATGSKQPTVVTNSLNGKTGVRFTSASSQTLDIASTGSIPATYPLTLIAVMNPVTLPAAQTIFAMTNAGLTTGYHVPLLVAQWDWVNTGVTAYALGSVAAVANTPILAVFTVDSSPTAKVATNGYNPEGQAIANIVAGANVAHIGSKGTVDYCNALFYDLIVLNVALAAKDQAKLNTWVRSRYALTAVPAISYNSPVSVSMAGKTSAGGSVTDAVEIGIIYNSAGVFGHKYWAAFAPYDSGNQDENPNVNFSDDGNAWSATGITNPIVAFPGGGAAGFNADPAMFDNTARDGTMYLFYTREGASSGNGVRYATSTNGTTWTDQSLTNVTTNYESPVVAYDPTSTNYWLYSMDLTSGAEVVYRRTCATPVGTYSAATACTFTTFPQALKPWHISAPIKVGSKWVMALSTTTSGGGQNVYELWLASSTDGLAWTVASTPLIVPGSWDNPQVYRSAIADAGDGQSLFLWYVGGSGVTGSGNHLSQQVRVPQALIP